jgi:hypothetical protein
VQQLVGVAIDVLPSVHDDSYSLLYKLYSDPNATYVKSIQRRQSIKVERYFESSYST